jgi:hypothetical protein
MASDSPALSAARHGEGSTTPLQHDSISSSFTPPPSSQLPTAILKQRLRTPSPVTSHLTSPPPTNRVPLLPISHPVVLSDLPTPEQVSHASVDDLRTMVDHLSIAVREARTAAAHYKLQHNMLQIDSSEASKRMEVELQLSHREIEVMQEAEERRKSEYMSPAQQAGHAALIGDLNRHCLVLHNENDAIREMLSRTVKDLEERDGQVLTLAEENRRLRHRIRMNREHMNGILDSVSDGSPRSLMGTPHRTPRHVASRAPMMQSSAREPNTFDALLLADKVLHSQDTATAPSTPKTTPLRHRGHVRNTHSLSSLPSTPARRALHPTAAQLHTPPHLTTIQEPYSQRTESQTLPPLFAAAGLVPPSATRRRASSDSTITASSVEDGDQQPSPSDDEVDEDAIPESQASQVATSMLRRTPNSSQQSLGKGKLTQSRIMGKVTKSGMGGEKRLGSFNTADLQGSPSKKGRVGKGGAVGLGIGI